MRRPHPSRSDWALTAVVVIAGVFYEWTARTSVRGPSHSYYYLLADAFLHLHTYLPIKVPAGLIALANPYDPAANAPFANAPPGFHDLSYFHGRFFTAWGPTPAVVLYLPLRLIGIEVTDANAAALFSIVALVFAVLLLRAATRRWVPAAPAWTVVLGACVLAFGTAVPFILRRPDIYEVAIACGAAMMMAGLYLGFRGLFGAPRPRVARLAGSSLCIGLAFGARPPLLLGGALLLAAAIVLHRRGERAAAIALLAPIAACVVLIAAYNQERFGSPTQVGVSYQLSTIDQSTKASFRLAYAKPGIYNYVFAPPRIALAFPHVFLPPPPSFPGSLPAGYAGAKTDVPNAYLPAEPTGGIIPTAPIVLFIVAAALLWRRRRASGRELPLAVAALGLLGAGIVLGLAISLWGTTERYEVDFDLLAILAGVLGWIGALSVIRRPRRRRVTAIAGAVAIAWSCVVGVAISFTGYYNTLARFHPGVFNTLEDITSPFATLAAIVAGRPVIARIESPAPVNYASVGYTSIGNGDFTTTLGLGRVTVVVDAPRSQNVWLRTLVVPGAVLPRSTPLAIVVTSPGRRPLTVHVYYGFYRLPIHLHLGLNRIVLDAWRGNPRGLTMQIQGVTVVSTPPPRPRHNASGAATG